MYVILGDTQNRDKDGAIPIHSFKFLDYINIEIMALKRAQSSPFLLALLHLLQTQTQRETETETETETERQRLCFHG